MATSNDSILRCPVCKAALEKCGRTLRCPQNHCFDQAKQGYFNLLLNQDKASNNPGDTAEMVQARRRFLELGHYQAIIDSCIALANTAQEGTHHEALPSEPFRYCDIACGEGYYTQRFFEAFLKRTPRIETTGIDISTPAIKAASRRIPDGTWLVANAFRLPLADETQDVVTHMFSRPCPSETSRVLKANGILIDVSAGTDHLIELRENLYPDLKIKDSSPDEPYAEQFSELACKRLRFEFTLCDENQIKDLITMTPHAWRASQERIDTTTSKGKLLLSADIELKALKRKN